MKTGNLQLTLLLAVITTFFQFNVATQAQDYSKDLSVTAKETGAFELWATIVETGVPAQATKMVDESSAPPPNTCNGTCPPTSTPSDNPNPSPNPNPMNTGALGGPVPPKKDDMAGFIDDMVKDKVQDIVDKTIQRKAEEVKAKIKQLTED